MTLKFFFFPPSGISLPGRNFVLFLVFNRFSLKAAVFHHDAFMEQTWALCLWPLPVTGQWKDEAPGGGAGVLKPPVSHLKPPKKADWTPLTVK